MTREQFDTELMKGIESMNSRKTYTEFFAQLDFLGNDYGNALETIEQQEKDIQKLMALLIENGIAIPSNLVDRYIKRIPDTDDMEDDLPF